MIDRRTHLHSIRQVPLHLIEHVFAATSEQHRASLGVLTLLQE